MPMRMRAGAGEQAGGEGSDEGNADGHRDDRDDGDEVGDDGGAGGSWVPDECVVDDVGEAGADDAKDDAAARARRSSSSAVRFRNPNRYVTVRANE